jgi:hypothetical protein
VTACGRDRTAKPGAVLGSRLLAKLQSCLVIKRLPSRRWVGFARSAFATSNLKLKNLKPRTSAKQRRFRLGDNALMGQEVVGDDEMHLFDFIEQTIGQGHEFVGLKYPARALFRFQEE